LRKQFLRWENLNHAGKLYETRTHHVLSLEHRALEKPVGVELIDPAQKLLPVLCLALKGEADPLGKALSATCGFSQNLRHQPHEAHTTGQGTA
jgi:hypothetical protein